MSSDLSPVLRLIPYLLAFGVAAFVGIPLFGGSELLRAVLVTALTYFGVFYLSRFIIERLASRASSTDDD